MGSSVKRSYRAAAAAVLTLAVCLALSGTAQAALTPPDTLEIHDVQVYRHLLETDDMLLVFRYNIAYDDPADQPDLPADKAFLFRLVDGANQTLGSNTPKGFYNQGYDMGCGSLYWADADAPVWGSGNATLRLEGNPTQFAGTPLTTHPMGAADYNSETEQEAIREYLKEHILDIADELEVNWGVVGELYSYTESGAVLSIVGEAYFTSAIIGLRTMCPDLFNLRLRQPTVEDQAHPQTQADSMKDRFDGTIIGDFIDGLGEFLGGIDGHVATTIGCVLALLAVVVLTAMRHQRAAPGFLIGFPLMLVPTAGGFVSWPILAIITLLCTFLLGYYLFMRHAGG